MISIHAPSRERLNFLGDGIDKLIFQSTLPYRSDSERDFRIVYTAISIHAPLRERRKNPLPADCWSAISIHAPSRERPSYALALLLRGLISIHAPSRERREPIEGLTIGVSGFQSTLPHGSDSSVCLFCARHTDFNPRSLTGATERQNVAPCVIYISIHAPSRERRKSKTCVLNNCYFNPRSLTGATQVLRMDLQTKAISIHAPSRERRLRCLRDYRCRDISIHAPSRERQAARLA